MKTILIVLFSVLCFVYGQQKSDHHDNYHYDHISLSLDSIITIQFRNDGEIAEGYYNPVYRGGIGYSGIREGKVVQAAIGWLLGNQAKPGQLYSNPADSTNRFYLVSVYDSANSKAYNEYQNAVAQGAPFVDRNMNGSYEPDEDLPDMYGDEMFWCVFNDSLRLKSSGGDGYGPSMILEIQQTLWRYFFALQDIIFIRQVISNPTVSKVEDILVSFNMDIDLGHYSDDLVGCDTLLNLGYSYNNGADKDLEGPPYALGTVIADNRDLQLEAFAPALFPPLPHFHWYMPFRFYQQAKISADYTYINPQKFKFGKGADSTSNARYIFSGDPLSQHGWLDKSQEDKKYTHTLQKFDLAPGASHTIYGAIVYGKGNSALNSVSVMKENAAKVLQAIRGGFKRADPPPAAGLEAIPGDKSVDLMIDLSDCYDYEEEDVLGNHYLFEGFALYQLAHADAEVGDPEQSRLIARYDLDNTYKDIYRLNDVGISEQVWDGQNNIGGLSADSNIVTHTVNMDAFSGKPINNFSRYHFTVRTFSLNYAALQPFNQTDEIENDWYAPRSFDIQFSPVAVQVAVLAGDDTEAVLDRVEAVPNPYFPGQGYNGAVRFIHLPQGAVIRIFDVAGRPVRSMTHTLEQPFWDWDLRNDAGRRVAGGIYLIHVSKSASGSRILKLAVVGEKK